MYYAKNRAALATVGYNHEFLSQLDDIAPTTDATLHQTEAGDYTLVYKGVVLHSPEGAEAEAKQLVQEKCRPDIKHCHFIFGMGLGYVLQAVHELSLGKIFIYESELPLLRFVLENVDLSDYLSARVYLASNSKALRHLVSNNYTYGDTVDVLFLHGYADLWRGELSRLVKEELMGIIQGKRNSVSTIFSFQKDWNHQFINNTRYFPQAEPFMPLTKRFQGKPAIVVSAGPSLEAAMDDIKKLQDKAVIIVVGTALRVVLKHGIKPDFVVFLDFEGPAKQLHGLEDQMAGISFMLGPFVEDACYKTNAQRLFHNHLSNYTDFSIWLARQIGELSPEISTGGTVSVLAYHIALTLGCNPIILVGQDLAISGQKLYAGGDTGVMNSEGQLRFEASETAYEKQVNLVEVKGQKGETLQSPPDYAQYINDLKEAGRREKHENPNLQLFNASVGGAQIDNFENCSLQELANKIAFETFDKTLPENEGYSSEEKTRRIQNSLEVLRSVCKDCIQIAGEAREYLTWLMQGIANGENGTNYERRYLILNKNFHQRLNAHGILHHMLQREVWLLSRKGNFTSQDLDDIIANYKVEDEFFEAATVALRGLIPVIDDSLEAMKTPSTAKA